MGDRRFKTAYSSAFGKRRGIRQAAFRPSSPRRKNNPHPIQDFLIYNRLPDPPDTNIKRKITDAIVVHRSKSAVPAMATAMGEPLSETGRHAGIGHTNGEMVKSAICHGSKVSEAPDNVTHWIEWPRKTPALTKIRPTLGPGPPRPHTTVGSHIRGEFVQEAPEDCQPLVQAKKMSARPPSYVEQAIARSLSPRRQPGAPGMPGRSYTHYHGYRIPVSYLGALDLQAPHYNYATGHQYPISNYTVYGPPPRESRPMHKHKSRKSSSDDNVHGHSVFTSTIPAVTGYYIIHPDWVSERASMRRSRSLMNLNQGLAS